MAEFMFDDEMEVSGEENDSVEENAVESTENVEQIDPIEIECIKCHKKFVLSPRDIKFYRSHGFKLPKHCYECGVNKRREQQFTCVDCGKTFIMCTREIEFFEKNGLHTPKRCKACRQFKKERNQAMKNEQ